MEVPQPRTRPLLGNVLDIDPRRPVESICELGVKHGSLYKINLFGRLYYYASSWQICSELFDETRFQKSIDGPIAQIRNLTPKGMFTADMGAPHWHSAHHVLIPSFGPLKIRAMFDDMKDVGVQLALKWARHEDTPIDAVDDFTRLALDTIALCSMDLRFNSFYKDKTHPFVAALQRFLVECSSRYRRPSVLYPLFYKRNRQYWADKDLMHKTSHDMLAERRTRTTRKEDLLDAMLFNPDPKTGKPLDDDVIVDNLVTFLAAGHETTAGTLAFLFYDLIKHPEAMKAAVAEVDKVLGTEPIGPVHLTRLPYITAVVRETLRLHPPVPGATVTSEVDEVVGGYKIHAGDPLAALYVNMHRDQEIYSDPHSFVPERMLDENFQKLPQTAWKPFGNGSRACIGRGFAWQEILITVAMLLQNFEFSFDDPNYTLQIHSDLTLKPKGLKIRAKLRHGTATDLQLRLIGDKSVAQPVTAQPQDATGKPISIYYGSNSGTCRAFASALAVQAASRGYKPRVDDLDAFKPVSPVVIITASYEGQPCDNGKKFQSWLEGLTSDVDLDYAVFGAGHSDWKDTFHRIPTLADSTLAQHGGRRICKMGLSNGAHGDMFGDFEAWTDKTFWPALKTDEPVSMTAKAQNTSGLKSLQAVVDETLVSDARVSDSRLLTAPNEPEKRHIEVELSETYECGDYLAVLPVNSRQAITRALTRFKLDAESKVSGVTAYTLLEKYVELGQPASRRSLQTLVQQCKSDKLQAMVDDHDSVIRKRLSLLDVLEMYPEVRMEFEDFIAALPPMSTRQYSISSSPSAKPRHATLTYAVMKDSHFSGEGEFAGVASSYLSRLQHGEALKVSVRNPPHAFRPHDGSTIMICAGSGIAPFRGFIQDRAIKGIKAPAVLVFGCREAAADDLYRDELDEWEAQGAVEVWRAYSRQAHGQGKYAQDVLYDNRARILQLWDQGAKVFICGGRALADGVQATWLKMYAEREAAAGRTASDEDAAAWFAGIRNTRYLVEVYS